MKLDKFNGGLSNRLDPSLIGMSEAVLYSNIDNSAGTLKSEKDVLLTTTIINRYFYIFEGDKLSSLNFRDYIEYDKTLYFTEHDVGSFKFKDGIINNLGIDAPVPRFAFDDSNEPIFNAEQSQVFGLVLQQEDFVYEDFIERHEVIGGSLAAGSYTYRLYIMDDNRQIAYFDKIVTVPALSGVIFYFKTGNKVKLTRYNGTNYRLIAEARNNVVDRGAALTATVVAPAISTDTIVVQYTYTYYNSVDGTESAPASLTPEYLRPIAKKIKIFNFTPPEDFQANYIRLYRNDSTLTVPTLMGEYPIDYSEEGKIKINPVYDIYLGADLTSVLDTYGYTRPPEGLKNLIIAYATLFGTVGRYLYFAVTDKPNAWPATNSIYFEADITGLLPVADGIIVFTLSKAFILVGTSIADFQVIPLSDEHGCLIHRSCKLVKNVPVWTSYQGICAYQGGSIDVISREKLGEINLTVENTTVHNQTYYILTSDNSILAMDLRFGLIFKTLFLGQRVYDIRRIGNDLWCNAESKIAQMFAGDELEFNYHSPEITEESITMRKQYNNIYCLYKGIFVIEILINGKLVKIESLESNMFKLVSIKVPTEKQSGEYIQFKVKGKGIIKELEYKVSGRSNGE